MNILVVVKGGMVQEVFCDASNAIESFVIRDFDVDNLDNSDVKEFDGANARETEAVVQKWKYLNTKPKL